MPLRSMWEHIRHEPQASQRELSKAMVSHWIVVRKFMHSLTGDSGSSLVLVEAYLEGNPEVTAEYLAERLGGMISDDTARRKLNVMVRREVITYRRSGRTKFYSIRPDIADAIIALMKGQLAILGSV